MIEFKGSHFGLVVTFVPKVPIWKVCYFNMLFLMLCDNMMI